MQVNKAQSAQSPLILIHCSSGSERDTANIRAGFQLRLLGARIFRVGHSAAAGPAEPSVNVHGSQ
jgi:hypothetical protein